MSSTPCATTLFGHPPCGACDPRAPVTPLPLANRPGLPRLRYRIGSFTSFREAMLNHLSVVPVRNLAPPAVRRELTTRSSDDYAIAMLDLWAYVCDVLTFYQQSIANEAFLRTATERDSLARIAALLGYTPAAAVGASAWLAFVADPGASVTVPGGLKTQSEPPADGSPQTFETGAPVAVSAMLNALTLLRAPTDLTFERGGDRGGEMRPRDVDAMAIATGTRLLFFLVSGQTFLTEDVVTAVTTTPRGRFVHWRAAISRQVSTVEVRKFDRKFRVFGVHAPGKYLKATTSGTTTSWSEQTMATDGTTGSDSFAISGNDLYLDAVYDGISVGSSVFLAHGTEGSLRTVTAVTQGSSTRGPLSGACTVITVNGGSVNYPDLRKLTIYEVTSAALPFFQTGAVEPPDPNDVGGGDAAVYLHNPFGTGFTSAFAKGSYLAVVDPRAPQTRFDVVQVSGAVSSSGTDMAVVPVTPPLVNLYDPAYARVYANLAPATQGETQPEQVVGDGDAAAAWQEFPISAAPITYVADVHADRGSRSTLLVFVDGVQWKEVDSLFGRSADEAIFITRVDESGKTTVRFGDGVTGRRLPSGRANVRARFRKGAGTDGNVGPGRINVLMQPLPGLKSVSNPLSSFGGAAAESRSALREQAPTSVVTLGRAVSLRDYEALALTYRGVVKARASWAEFGDRRGVALTVAAAVGTPLALLAPDLKEFLDARRDPNVPLAMREGVRIPFVFRARVHVESGVKQSVVKAAAERVLGPAGDGFLSYDALQFGQTIFQSELISTLQAVAGAKWVELLELSCAIADHPFGGDALHRDAIVIGPAEIAWASLTGSTTTATVGLQFSGGFADLEAILMYAGLSNLYDLLPEFIRRTDAEQAMPLDLLIPVGQPGRAELEERYRSVIVETDKKMFAPPLRTLLAAVQGQADLVQADIEALYENFFVETADGWLLPYIADLIALNALSPDEGLTRREVARTIAYRRRKGTVPQLETMAADVTGYDVRVVEFFQRMIWNQNLIHLRPASLATVDVRDRRALARIDTAFDRTSHTADVRPSTQRQGRYNIRKLGFFVWRLRAIPLTRVRAFRAPAGTPAGSYLFSTIGVTSPLFQSGRALERGAGADWPRVDENSVDAPLPPWALMDSPAEFGLRPHGLRVLVNGAVVTQTLIPADLCKWNPGPAAGQIAVDPRLGRFRFAAGEAPNAGDVVETDYAFGLSGEIGGGGYDRLTRLSPFPGEEPLTTVVHVSAVAGPNTFPTIAQALAQLATSTAKICVVHIDDSRTYSETLTLPAQFDTLVIQAGDRQRPTLQLTATATAFSGPTDGRLFVLRGLLITGAGQRLTFPARLECVVVEDCTVDPGGGLNADGIGLRPAGVRIEVNPTTTAKPSALRIERSIVGALTLPVDMTAVTLTDSIADAQAFAGGRILLNGPPACVERSTLLGTFNCHRLEASESIFAGVTLVDRQQEGCVRFCYFAPDSEVPRKFKCAPATPGVLFTSSRFGDPAYAQLALNGPAAILAGDNGREMGVWASLAQPRRLAHLQMRLAEYLPAGLVPVVIFVT